MPTSNHVEVGLLRALASYATHVGAYGEDGFAALSGTGPIAELEARLAEHYGMRYAVCVASATVGIQALICALGLDGAEILTSPISYGATLAPLLVNGCSITFADVDAGTLALDPLAVRRAIGPRTKAILAVDVLGVPNDTEALRAAADAAGVWYLADAAQSLGASRKGRPASSAADALVTSFGPGKTIFAGGEGGAVMTNDPHVYERVVWWTQHPLRQVRDLGLERANEFALNGRMHGLAAAWANAVFDESLRRLRGHQACCFGLIQRLERDGWMEALPWSRQEIWPAFFRVSAVWNGQPRPEAFARYLAESGYEAELVPLPVRLLYKEPAFLARAPVMSDWDAACPIAARELDRRFCLTVHTAVPAMERRFR